MKIIEKTEDLKVLCEELNKQKFITVDTEFVREKTYFPLICLIQVGWIEDAAIIDPMSKDIDLSAFFEVLQNKNVLKVFHSGRQDIEIFYNMSGKIPTPVFDTQIAAMACGFGNSIGYDNLVSFITGVELDKSSRLTDWSKRPLQKNQLEYALRDVTFLIPCYEFLDKYLKENNRTDWIKEELEYLLNEEIYKPQPENMWLRIRHSAHSLQYLSVLKALASWREKRAIKYNIPRKTLLKDEILVNIASSAPKTIEELANVRYIRSDIVNGKLGKEIVEVINDVLSKPLDKELKRIEKEKQVNIPPNTHALIEVLKLLLKIISEQNHVVECLIADEKDLRDIACGNNDKTNPALQGWRFEIFGKYALDFRKGKASICYDNQKKKIVINSTEQKNKS